MEGDPSYRTIYSTPRLERFKSLAPLILTPIVVYIFVMDAEEPFFVSFGYLIGLVAVLISLRGLLNTKVIELDTGTGEVHARSYLPFMTLSERRTFIDDVLSFYVELQIRGHQNRRREVWVVGAVLVDKTQNKLIELDNGKDAIAVLFELARTTSRPLEVKGSGNVLVDSIAQYFSTIRAMIDPLGTTGAPTALERTPEELDIPYPERLRDDGFEKTYHLPSEHLVSDRKTDNGVDIINPVWHWTAWFFVAFGGLALMMTLFTLVLRYNFPQMGMLTGGDSLVLILFQLFLGTVALAIGLYAFLGEQVLSITYQGASFSFKVLVPVRTVTFSVDDIIDILPVAGPWGYDLHIVTKNGLLTLERIGSLEDATTLSDRIKTALVYRV